VDAVTPRDLELIEVGLALGVHTFTISFVERAEDIRRAREYASSLGHTISIIAKIERKAAVDHIDELLADADGVMVARGDLGVQIPIERCPWSRNGSSMPRTRWASRDHGHPDARVHDRRLLRPGPR
jgi:pyruvate kinase